MSYPDIKDIVREKYAAAALRVDGGGSCCGASAELVGANPITSNLYGAAETGVLPDAAVLASLGCGNPTALAELQPGETVLDLGSGGGIDVLLSARRVGPTGKAFGLDMTDEMLALARENQLVAGAENVEFLKGEIEAIPLPDNSVDVIISNCVINLSADKDRVLREAFRVLKPNGRFAVSDVVTRGEVPERVRQDMLLWVGCIAGALEENDYRARLEAAGFKAIGIEPTRIYKVEDARAFLTGKGLDVDALAAEVDGKFMSAFVRAVKARCNGVLRAGLLRLTAERMLLSGQTDTVNAPRETLSMGVFERFLTFWVALCIVVGIALGQIVPSMFRSLGAATVAQVNLPVAVLVWLMIVPMLLKIDLAAIGQVKDHWRGIAATVGVNWLVKPFSMALLGWLFIGHLFRPLLPTGQIDGYIAGLILLAAAPCTAMVFVWSNLVDGEPHFTLSQVALNDTIMVFAFAPLVALLLGLSSITVPWDTLLLSVVLYIVVPVIVAQLWRRWLLAQCGPPAMAQTLRRLSPLSLGALLLTLVLLFGLQGEQIMQQPIVIALLAVPILIQVYFNAALAYWLNRRLGVAWCVAGPSALIGASNFFELAVATAIALFGFQSGAALATVVGVLVEVPVMLSVVQILRRSRTWYERGAGARDAPQERRA